MRLGPSGSLSDFEHISTPAEKVRVNHGLRQPIFSAEEGVHRTGAEVTALAGRDMKV
jgi:hypothetical protein